MVCQGYLNPSVIYLIFIKPFLKQLILDIHVVDYFSVFVLLPLATRVLVSCRQLYCQFLLLENMFDSRAINKLLTYLVYGLVSEKD